MLLFLFLFFVVVVVVLFCFCFFFLGGGGVTSQDFPEIGMEMVLLTSNVFLQPSFLQHGWLSDTTKAHGRNMVSPFYELVFGYRELCLFVCLFCFVYSTSSQSSPQLSLRFATCNFSTKRLHKF